MVEAMEDIILQYTYPRLDAEVSKHRNHLLKAPFCVHPATGTPSLISVHWLLIRNLPIGRVCVPVNPDKVGQFDPEAVPTVGQLLRELDEQTLDGGDGRAGSYHMGAILYDLTLTVHQIGSVRHYDRMSKCWTHTSGVSCRRPVRPSSVCGYTYRSYVTHLTLSIGGKGKLDW